MKNAEKRLALTRKAYNNIQMTNPDGKFIAFLDEDRAQRYLNKGLATPTEEGIQLNFDPKFDRELTPFETASRHHRCVVCGHDGRLNKHHIVPRCFRECHTALQNARSHDVVAVCIPCHNNYEVPAQEFRAKLLQEAGIIFRPSEDSNIGFRDFRHRESLKRVLALHSDRIPADRREEMNRVIESLQDAEVPPVVESKYRGGHKRLRIPEHKLIDPMDEDALFAFVQRWRQHFLDYAQPKFMPEGWSVDYKLPD
jgi:hypothetical protein